MATIITKNSSTASSVPLNTQLVQGELAVNVTDKRLFTENASGTVVELGTNPSSLTLPNGVANAVCYLNGSKVLTTGSALTFDGTNFAAAGNAAGTVQSSARNDNTTTNAGAKLATLYTSTEITSLSHYWDGSQFLGKVNAIGDLLFTRNNSEQMRLTSTGLGIGTSSPGAKLHVAGDIQQDNAQYLKGKLAAGTATRLFGLNTANTLYIGSVDADHTGGTLFVKNGSAQMTLDSSGNLGLGVTPSAWSQGKALFFQGGAAGGDSTFIDYTQNATLNSGWKYIANGNAVRYEQYNGAHAWFTAPSGTAGNAISFTQAMTLTAGGVQLLGTTSTPSGGSVASVLARASTTNLQVHSTDGGGAMYGGLSGGGAIFYTYTGAVGSETYTERARIDSSGNLLVGTTTNGAGAKFFVSADLNTYAMSAWNYNAAPLGLNIYYAGAAPNNTGSEFFVANDTVGMKASVRSNGGIANYSGNNVNLSDRREKTNFAPAGEYLSKICAIPVQTFNYINQNMEEDPGTTLGVVAQDVQDVAPELVMESNWGTKEEPKMRLSIYQTDLQYALMKCIQEQQAIIQTLTARIEALEAK